MIELKNIDVVKGERKILRNINLKINLGERVGIFGPNGSGKSTLLKVLALVEEQISGQIFYNEKDIKSFNSEELLKLRRKLSFVFQHPNMLRGTVLQNVIIPLKIRGFDDKQAANKAKEWLKIFDLEKFANRSVHSLSGGELARVQLARALSVEPEILFLDEPFTSVDNSSKTFLKGILREFLKTRNVSLFLISHSFKDLIDLTQRTIFLIHGKIINDEKTEELVRKPLVTEMIEEDF